MQAGKTLFTGDLERNGLGAGSVDAIYELIYGGKGKMPGYGSGCTPRVSPSYGLQANAVVLCFIFSQAPQASTFAACMQGKCTFGPRLSDGEIMRLSAYVLDQAAKGWK